jgi:hypothetical protein
MLETWLWTVVIAFGLAFVGETMANLKVRFRRGRKKDLYDSMISLLQYLIILAVPFLNVFVAAIVFLMGLFMTKEHLEYLIDLHG